MFRKGIAAAGLVSAVMVAGPVLAADMPTTFEPAPPPAPAPAPAPVFYDWTGVYAGLHAGYAWGDRDLSVDDFPPDGASFNYDSNGWLLGGQLGANWQVNQWVFGVEGDLAWSGVDGSMTTFDPVPGIIDSGSESHDMKWLGTLRGRIGIAVDSFLFYGTGGLAFAKYDSTAVINWADDVPASVASDSNSHTGWTLGAGIEAGLTENLSVKAEYLYVDLGSKNYNYNFVDAPNTTVSADHQHHVVRAGLNYRFNW